MRNTKLFHDVRRILLRKGFRREYALRAALEVSEHWADLVDEEIRGGHSVAEAEALASRRIGNAPALADGFAQRMQTATWLGRHSALGFSLLPILLTFMWWAISFGSISAWLQSVSANGKPDIELLKMSADWTRVVGVVAVPLLICHLAARFFCGWQAALWGCLILAIHNAMHSFAITGTPGQEQMTWSYGFSTSRGPNVAALGLPLAIFAVFWIWNSRKEKNETRWA